MLTPRPTVGADFEQLTVSGRPVSLTAAKFKDSADSRGCDSCFITNYGAPIRYTYDGTEPTHVLGHVLPDGGILTLRGHQQMSSFKCIRASVVNSEISITYERE